jgi:hypothetical protein
MKLTLLFLNLFISGIVFSQCWTYDISNTNDDYVTTSPGSTISSVPIVILNNLNVTYQWLKNDIPISNGVHYSGVTTNQVTINNVNYSDDGFLRCHVTNIVDGCIDTIDFYIDVCESISLQPTNVTTTINSTAIFSTNINNPNATYKWRTDLGAGFNDVTNAGQYSGANTNTLTVSYVSMANNNQLFYCRIGSTCDNNQYTDTVVLLINSTNSLDEINHINSSISPNPSAGDFKISGLELYNNISRIYISDVNGTLVKELDTTSSKFSLGTVQRGVYFLTISADNKHEVIKLIKE